MNGGTRRPSGAVVVDAVSTGTLQNTVARLSGVSGQRLVLRWVGGSEPGRELPIPTTAALVLGRSADADVGVRDLAVSRSHARIAWQGDQLFIADLVSANGTFVNGALIRTPTRLGPGDEIMLGDTTLRMCKSRGGSSCSAPTPMVAIDVDMAFRETIRAIGGALEYVPLADVMQLLAGTRPVSSRCIRPKRRGEFTSPEAASSSQPSRVGTRGPRRATRGAASSACSRGRKAATSFSRPGGASRQRST